MWKNFEELEENLNLHELETLLEAAREQEHQRQRFAAALKGIDIDENNRDSDTPTFEDVKRRAEAKIRGVTEEELELANIGIAVIEE